MPETMPSNVKKPELSEDDRMFFDFVNFVKANEITANQLREAYYRLTGVSDRHDDEAVEMVRREMESMTSRHFPLNRFVTLIGTKEQYEDAPQELIRLFDALPVTDKEKAIMRSIVEKRRNGELIFNVGKHGSITMVIHFPKTGSVHVESLQLLDGIQQVIAKIGERPFEIIFIES